MVSPPFGAHVKLGAHFSSSGAFNLPGGGLQPRKVLVLNSVKDGAWRSCWHRFTYCCPKTDTRLFLCYNWLRLVLIAPVLRRRWHGF